MRRTEADERGHEVHAVVGVYALGQLLGLGGVLDDAEPVPEPLDRGPGYEDGSFEGVLDRLISDAPGDGR